MQKKKFPKQDEIDFDSFRPDAMEEACNESEIIFSYSRAEALADEELKDVSEMAKEVGFRYPVALTVAAWQKVVAVPQFSLSDTEEARLWTVLDTLRWAAAGCPGDELEFAVDVSSQYDGSEEVRLRAVCGEGDDKKPVITVMLPHED
jgi:hypothetical protein